MPRLTLDLNDEEYAEFDADCKEYNSTKSGILRRLIKKFHTHPTILTEDSIDYSKEFELKLKEFNDTISQLVQENKKTRSMIEKQKSRELEIMENVNHEAD